MPILLSLVRTCFAKVNGVGTCTHDAVTLPPTASVAFSSFCGSSAAWDMATQDDLAAAFGSLKAGMNEKEDDKHAILPPRAQDYKSKGDFATQEARRRTAIERQRRGRRDLRSFARRLALEEGNLNVQDVGDEGDWVDVDADNKEEEEDNGDSMAVAKEMDSYNRIVAADNAARRKAAKKVNYR